LTHFVCLSVVCLFSVSLFLCVSPYVSLPPSCVCVCFSLSVCVSLSAWECVSHFSKILIGLEDSTTPLFAQQRDSDSSLKEYIITGCVMSTNLFLIHHVQHAMKNCQGWPEHMNKNRKRYPDTINRSQGRPVF